MVQTITAVGQTLKVTLAWTDPSARVSPGGESFDHNCLSFANANNPWFLINVSMLQTPIATNQTLNGTRRKRRSNSKDERIPGP